MKAIIFGANGQDGHYLYQLLTERGFEVYGVSRSGNWIHGNVSDHAFVTTIIKEHKPHYIFHLAANSVTAHDAWLENHHTICDGTLFILEAVKLYSPLSKVFISGSGLQFENNGQPIVETDPFFAGSPYAVSRIQSAYATRYYRSIGIKAYIGYFFNHESPFRTERHMSKKIATFAKRVAAGYNDTLQVGDITVRKEWTYAKDIVEAIMTLVSQDIVFEAVLGSGVTYSIKDWVSACFEIAGKNWEPYIEMIEGFVPEYKELVSNPKTILSLGWRQTTDFTALAKIMMN